MSIDISTFDGDPSRWNSLVDQSPDTNAFHRYEALQLQADHSGAALHMLVGHKGQEPVGLFPVFELTKGPFVAMFSPPPPLWIHRLGPATLNMGKLKRRKRDKRTRRFIEGCLEWLDENCDPNHLQVRTEGSYRDVRPFKWNDADVTPEYTYIVDLRRSEEALMAAFSSDARRNVRNTDRDEYSVEVGDAADVERIVEQVRARYQAQGKGFNLPTEFCRDLYRELDGLVRPYVCHHRGEYAGGILTFEDDTRIHRWQGGVKTDADIPVNDLLDWHVMTDAMARGIEEYDLVGAGDRRITDYKSKFAPSLVDFYTVERGSVAMRALLGVYKKIN